MKRVCVFLAVVLLTGSMALGQVTQVVSRNAVGYVKVEVKGNGFFMGAIPFYEVGDDGEHTVAEIFGDQLVGGFIPALSDNVLKFDPVAGSYVTFWKTTGGQWRQAPEIVETTNTLAPGEAFWIANRQSSNQTVFLMGEVPDKFTVATSTQTVNIIEGFQFVSYSFPTEIAITNLSLDTDAQRGFIPALSDNILTWNGTNYVTYWLPTSGDWRKAPELVATTDTLLPGQGAWYNRRNAAPIIWKEEKPYAWP